MLKNSNPEKALAAHKVYQECTQEMLRLSRKERKDLLLSKFNNYQVFVCYSCAIFNERIIKLIFNV